MIIAQTVLYRKVGKKAKRVRIAIHRPERDPRHPRDFRCRVQVTGERPRIVFGVDSFQALNLAFILLRSIAKGWAKRPAEWHWDRGLEHRYDIQGMILNDLFFYEKLGRRMLKQQQKQTRRKPHA